jgi:DNA-binding transcriptional LysR family regulator
VAHRELTSDVWVLVAPERDHLGTVRSPLALLRGQRLIVHRDQLPPVDISPLGIASVFPCDRSDTVLGLVRSGVGCAILPRLALPLGDHARGEGGGLTLVALGGLLPARPISIAWNPARRLPLEIVDDLLAQTATAGVSRLAAAA